MRSKQPMAKTPKNESVFPLAESIRRRGEDISPRAQKQFDKDMQKLNKQNDGKLK
jgi:hypothetical protein